MYSSHPWSILGYHQPQTAVVHTKGSIIVASLVQRPILDQLDGRHHERVTVAIRGCPVPPAAPLACMLSTLDSSVTLTQVPGTAERSIGPDTESSQDPPCKSFRFDAVFDAASSTRRVYDQVVHQIVQSSLNGINGSVLAAGSTNTGKTHTIMGGGGSLGLITMALMDVFAARAKHESTRMYTITATMVEIYNEQIIDLLADDGGSSPVHVVVCYVSATSQTGFCYAYCGRCSPSETDSESAFPGVLSRACKPLDHSCDAGRLTDR